MVMLMKADKADESDMLCRWWGGLWRISWSLSYICNKIYDKVLAGLATIFGGNLVTALYDVVQERYLHCAQQTFMRKGELNSINCNTDLNENQNNYYRFDVLLKNILPCNFRRSQRNLPYPPRYSLYWLISIAVYYKSQNASNLMHVIFAVILWLCFDFLFQFCKHLMFCSCTATRRHGLNAILASISSRPSECRRCILQCIMNSFVFKETQDALVMVLESKFDPNGQ